MRRFYPNTHISDCWGSAGNITYYHRDGKCYWRRKSRCGFGGSAAQLQQLDVHRRALMAWRLQPESIKETWRSLAVGVAAHRPPFLNENHISGYNLFVSAYHGFALMGDEIVPEPRPFTPFTNFDASMISSSRTGGMLQLRFRLALFGCAEPDRYRLLCKVQVCKAGRGCHPGKMRNHLAEPIDSDSVALSVLVPAELAQASDVQLHVRYLLIDTVTGYRSNFKKLSFLASNRAT